MKKAAGSAGKMYTDKLPLRYRWPLRKVLLLAAGLVVLIIIGEIVYGLSGHTPPTPKVVCTEKVPEDYQVMTKRQIACKFQADTGMSLADITEKPLSAGQFKDFKSAHAAAQALRALQQYDRSLKAYGIAENKATGSDANYQFYLDYAVVADVQKDTKLFDALNEKAKQAIQNDTTLSADLKQTELDKLNSRLRRRALGY